MGRAQKPGSPWDCEHLSGNGQGAKQHLCGIGEAPSSQTDHHHLVRAAGLQGKDRTYPFWKHCRTSACYVAPLAPASTTVLVLLSLKCLSLWKRGSGPTYLHLLPHGGSSPTEGLSQKQED